MNNEKNSDQANNTLKSDSSIDILMLNVCGLRNRLDHKEFTDELCKHDMFMLTETKTDDVDIPFIESCFAEKNFAVKVFNRRKLTNWRSGGICIGYSTSKFKDADVTFVKNECKFVKWIIVKVGGIDKPILFGAVYIPPRGSTYTSITCYDEIQTDLLNFIWVTDSMLLKNG